MSGSHQPISSLLMPMQQLKTRMLAVICTIEPPTLHAFIANLLIIK